MFKKILFLDMQLFNIPIQQKCCFVLFLSIAWNYLCLKNKPFNDFDLNIIDTYSNLSISIIAFSGCLYVFDINEFMRPILYVIILLLNSFIAAKVIKSILDVVLQIEDNYEIFGRFNDLKISYYSLKISLNTTSFSFNICKYFADVLQSFKLTFLEFKSQYYLKQRVKFTHLKK